MYINDTINIVDRIWHTHYNELMRQVHHKPINSMVELKVQIMFHISDEIQFNVCGALKDEYQ